MRIIFLFLTFWLGFAPALRAAEGPWLKTDFAEIRLISAAQSWDVRDRADTWRAALEVYLQPGWKIYWRSPGDAGLPTQFFADQPYLEAGYKSQFLWPVPERFTLFGLETYGYGGRVILPMDISVPAGQPAFISGMVDALACSDICVPLQGPVSLGLAAGEGGASAYAQDIAYARAHVPSGGSGPDIDIQSIEIDVEASQLLVRYDVGALTLADIFIEGAGPGYSFARPDILSTGLAQIAVAGKELAPLKGKALRLTVIAGDQRREVVIDAGNAAKDAPPKTGPAGDTSIAGLLSILLIAFLGGVILNVMPCVLPVLSLKITSVLSISDGQAAGSYKHVRQRFLASAAGILFSFALLGGGLILVRAAGIAVGWGIQFQHPVFLGFMFAVLGLFTLSLFDKVMIPIPGFAAQLSPAKGDDKLKSDFVAGMLATLLATPCSAPFVGSAVTFSITAPDLKLMLVMLVMGAGLASPWLLLAIRPAFISYLPKPGAWMVRIKQLMGIFLLGTMIWVGWLFAGAVGWRAAQISPAANWQVWSDEKMEAELAAGQIVFLDVTADWCITCKTNKALVLDGAAGQALINADDITRLQADWTRPDAAISALLARYDRYGIPFNLVIHKNLPEPVILPEILTLKAIETALKAARARAAG